MREMLSMDIIEDGSKPVLVRNFTVGEEIGEPYGGIDQRSNEHYSGVTIVSG